MRLTRKDGSQTIDLKDALELEEIEQMRIRNRNTRRAIHDTYGPKSATKARRKLPGKRHWKNKSEQYKLLEGQMTVKEFNSKSRASKIIERIFKERQAEKLKKESGKKKHMLYGNE